MKDKFNRNRFVTSKLIAPRAYVLFLSIYILPKPPCNVDFDWTSWFAITQ